MKSFRKLSASSFAIALAITNPGMSLRQVSAAPSSRPAQPVPGGQSLVTVVALNPQQLTGATLLGGGYLGTSQEADAAAVLRMADRVHQAHPGEVLFSRLEDQVLIVPKDLVVSHGATERQGGGAVEEGQVTVGVYSVGGQEDPKVLEVSLEVARDLQQQLRTGNVGQAFAKLGRTFDLSGAGLAGGPVAVGSVIPALDEAQVGLAARFISIPPGTFLMGSPAHEMERFDGETLHEVTLTHSILVQATPVTQRQFREIMGYDPSYFHGDGTGNHPVENVTWYDAVEFANRLSVAAGLKPAYRIQVKKRRTNRSIEDAKVEVNGRDIHETNGYKKGKAGFRLPTEAEGEYFTRAGSVSPYSFGSDVSLLGNYAWYDQNSSVQTHEVGMKNPNAWGIYDVHGNVYEWRQDGYEETYSEVSVIDPIGSGSRKVIRGGSWRNDPGRLRSAHRTYDDPDARWYVVGLRLVRSIP